MHLETQNLKETGSIHLYICNSKAHQGLVKSECLCPTNSGFVHARFCIISAIKQTNIPFEKIKTSAAPTYPGSRAQG